MQMKQRVLFSKEWHKVWNGQKKTKNNNNAQAKEVYSSVWSLWIEKYYIKPSESNFQNHICTVQNKAKVMDLKHPTYIYHCKTILGTRKVLTKKNFGALQRKQFFKSIFQDPGKNPLSIFRTSKDFPKTVQTLIQHLCLWE